MVDHHPEFIMAQNATDRDFLKTDGGASVSESISEIMFKSKSSEINHTITTNLKIVSVFCNGFTIFMVLWLTKMLYNDI